MAISKINIVHFLELSGHIPVVDVRSPSEFLSGHIPGAINIPLFSDSEREAVGTKYKKEGRIASILEGLKLTGHTLSFKLEQALGIAKEGKLLVHCWRGGMRSEAMAWLFSQGDIDIFVLDGGYKQYRHYILESLAQKPKMIVLGGMTGSSKSHILRHIKLTGRQVIDLEGLANHKGSAFGSLGQLPQPSTEHFANMLYDEWQHIDAGSPVWIEDESRNIGSVFIPDPFYSNMQEAPAIILMMDIKTRLSRLMEEYAAFPAEALKASILRISRRLGGDNTNEALIAVEKGDFGKAISIALRYYDKAYMYGLKKKDEKKIIFLSTDTDNIEINTAKIIEASQSIDWNQQGFIVH